MAIVSITAIVSKLPPRRILENSWLLPNLVKQCLRLDIGIFWVTDTEVESAGERGVRYMSVGKRVCTDKKTVSDS